MNTAVDLVTGIWGEAVAIVGAGAVEFTGAAGVGVVGMGWAITFTLYLPLASMVLLFLSLVLGPRASLVMGLAIWGDALVLGCSWVWGWSLGMGPSLPSNSKYIFWMREG